MTDAVASTEAPAAEVVVADDATLVTAPAAEGEKTNAEEAEAKEAGSEAEAGAEVEAEAEAEDEAPKGAPEAYADFAMPEGIALDTELADQFKGVAKELNLPQEAAQRVIDLAVQMRQRDAEAIVALRSEWIEQTKADKEVGGDKLDATLSVAKKAIDAHGSPQFIQLLNESGLGNHPEVVRFMAKVGRSLSEDKMVAGGVTASTPQGSLAERLFKPSKE